jgi:hypothetical protein
VASALTQACPGQQHDFDADGPLLLQACPVGPVRRVGQSPAAVSTENPKVPGWSRQMMLAKAIPMTKIPC